MNKYTYKVEKTGEKKFMGKMVDIWTFTVYKNGDVYETGTMMTSEAADSRAKAIADNAMFVENLKAESDKQHAEWVANGSVPFDNGSGDIEMGIGSHNYESIQERNRTTSRQRFVEDENGDIVEEIEILEDTDDDNEIDTNNTIWHGIFSFSLSKLDKLSAEQDAKIFEALHARYNVTPMPNPFVGRKEAMRQHMGMLVIDSPAEAEAFPALVEYGDRLFEQGWRLHFTPRQDRFLPMPTMPANARIVKSLSAGYIAMCEAVKYAYVIAPEFKPVLS